MEKALLYLWLFLFFIMPVYGQKNFDPSYTFVRSGSFVQDKNYYLLTLMEEIPEVNELLTADKVLKEVFSGVKDRLNTELERCGLDISCRLELFQLTEDEQQKIKERFKKLIQKEPVLKELVQQHLRPSGRFMRYAEQSDEALFLNAWQDALNGLKFCETN